MAEFGSDGIELHQKVTGGGGGGGNTIESADVTPGPTGITRTGLQDFDGQTGADGDIVFVFGGGGTQRINSGLWVMHSGAWTRPTGWTTGDDVAGKQVAIKNGTVHKGALYFEGDGACILGTDQQHWSLQARLTSNSDSPPGIGSILLSAGSGAAEFTWMDAPDDAGFVLTSSGNPSIQPQWEAPAGGSSVADAGRLAGPDEPPTIIHGQSYIYDQVTPDVQDFASGSNISIGIPDGFGATTFLLEPGIYQATAIAQVEQETTNSILLTVGVIITDLIDGDCPGFNNTNSNPAIGWTTLPTTTIGKVTNAGGYAYVVITNHHDTDSVSLQGMTFVIERIGDVS